MALAYGFTYDNASSSQGLNRFRLYGLEPSARRENEESNAVKLPLHKSLPSGVDGGVHTGIVSTLAEARDEVTHSAGTVYGDCLQQEMRPSYVRDDALGDSRKDLAAGSR